MKRDRLTGLVRTIAGERGYTFHSGEEHLMNGAVRVYPAVWLTPPAVKTHSGRNEGETVWRLTLHVMMLPTENTTAETLWQKEESDALRMVAELVSSPDVCSVTNVGCTPSRRSLTTHGETSVTLTCDITMWYYL